MKSHALVNPDPTAQNQQSGQEVAKQIVLGHFPEQPETVRRRSPKSHSDYWKSRLFRPFYTRDGQVREVNDLAVRIQHGGRRETFTLATTNKDVAAAKARDIWITVRGAGWDAAIAKFKPDQDVTPKVDVTIGELLDAVKKSAGLRLRTLVNYANCLRTIASEAIGIHPAKGTSKYDYRSGGNTDWRQRVDAIKLTRLTPEVITQWQRQRVADAGNSEVAKASARRTCNSYVRCARSLFSPSILKNLKNITLPDPLPFAGVELLEAGSMKYVSRINVETLIAAAKSKLKKKDPEAYKVFLLGLFAGLRKSEIDLIDYSMVDFDANVIRLRPTDFLHLKTNDSAGEITVDAELLSELRQFKESSRSQFIISSEVVWNNGKKKIRRTRLPRNDSVRTYYRCAPVFNRLNIWLRSKGIQSNKPLHELRKEVGAIIATKHGIFAAGRFLRHGDITTTARHYADHKDRIEVGIGKLLLPRKKAAPKPPPA